MHILTFTYSYINSSTHCTIVAIYMSLYDYKVESINTLPRSLIIWPSLKNPSGSPWYSRERQILGFTNLALSWLHIHLSQKPNLDYKNLPKGEELPEGLSTHRIKWVINLFKWTIPQKFLCIRETLTQSKMIIAKQWLVIQIPGNIFCPKGRKGDQELVKCSYSCVHL